MNKCPQCGYSEKIEISKFSSVMHLYENEKGKRVALNSEQPSFVIEGATYYKVDPKTDKPIIPTTTPKINTPASPK